MPPLPVIPFTWRIRLDWNTSNGIKPVNIFHVSGPWTTAEEVHDDLEAAFFANQWTGISNAYHFDTVTVTALDGVTASQTFTDVGLHTGGSSGQPILNCSVMVELSTLVRGAKGRGRLFLGPTTESVNIGGNVIDATIKTNTVNGWNSFQGSLLALPGGGATMVVASYVHAEANPVQSISVDDILRSTKSRLNQLTG